MAVPIPELKPLFVAKGIVFYGVERDSGMRNDKVQYKGQTIELSAHCSETVTDRKTKHLRGCVMQIHSLYTLSLSNPQVRKCAVHFTKHHSPPFYESISETFNAMCDQLNASYDQRRDHLKLQHINHFLGDLWSTKDALLADLFLLGVIFANCSAQYCDSLYDRSHKDASVTLDGFPEEDEDTGSNFAPETSDDEDVDDIEDSEDSEDEMDDFIVPDDELLSEYSDDDLDSPPSVKLRKDSHK